MGKAFIAENRDASSVNKDGWNKLRIRAEGDHITIEQNGKKVVDIHDKTFPGPGSIGIQLHAGKQFEGMVARVRKIRVRPLD
jgi:3-keto-disaccharide hydrolase